MNHSLLLKRAVALSGARRGPADRQARWSIPHRRWAWLALGVSCAAYVLASLALHQAFHPWGRPNFFDLKVYRGTLAIPALLLLGVRVVRLGSRAGLAAVVAILLVGYVYLPKLMTKPAFVPRHGPSVVWALAGASYVLLGPAALATAISCEARRAAHAIAVTRPGSRHGLATPAIAAHAKGTR